MSKYVLIAFDFRGRMEIIRFMFAAAGVKVRREKDLHFVQNSTILFSQPSFSIISYATNLACVAERTFASVGSKGVPGTCEPPPPGPIIFFDFMQFLAKIID